MCDFECMVVELSTSKWMLLIDSEYAFSNYRTCFFLKACENIRFEIFKVRFGVAYLLQQKRDYTEMLLMVIGLS